MREEGRGQNSAAAFASSARGSGLRHYQFQGNQVWEKEKEMSPEKERPDTDNSARVLLEIKEENEDEYTGGILKSVAASRDENH